MIRHFYLRDPNYGADERAAFERAAQESGSQAWDDSGPAEGYSPPWPRAVGLGTVVTDCDQIED